ncbi:MAG: 1-acyl-sn-glycerol-3-phosphate acyltransferase [Sorangiineae bacterium]|nr:1-acyl-sn-glycerol-3-phosphate acyltransferase [Polyangiaceae bacterium]MEB2321975.1 1-acyl-sn-glycerol-3-phosphate acyltransferase [Sorangiineae bacterium]
MRPEDRERAQLEAAGRVVDRHLRAAGAAPHRYLEDLLGDTLYEERRRLDRADPRDPRTRADLAYYHRLQRELRHASGADLARLVADVARRFAQEIVGSFDERVYRITTTAVPAGLSLLLGAMRPRLTSLDELRRGVASHLELRGAAEHVRRLEGHGTLVVVPTHSSHLDSIVLGYAVHLLGMPPLLYGAGLNLFDNPLVSFFMNHLGAYRIDRKKGATLYKDVLKEYASYSLELGYHNLFFPGGTRSRSGAVERHLKKGLLGTTIPAYLAGLARKQAKPNIYYAPCTISYKLVLEAETLIDDYLKETGRSQYVIDDDEFSRPRRILNFMAGLVSMDSRIVVTFSPPLDLFGNPVDEAGRSLDPRGRVIDPSSYVTRHGAPVHDEQRDRQYTEEAAQAIGAAFQRDTVVLSTHVVAHAMFRLLERHNPELDRYRLLRTGGATPSFPVAELAHEVEWVLAALERRADGPRKDAELGRDAAAIIDDATRHFGTYHRQAALVRRGERVFHQDRPLLLYYGNRVGSHALA